MRCRWFPLALAGLVLAATAFAQPAPFPSYWPNEDGRQWRYDQRFELFTATPPGVVESEARMHLEGTTVAPVGIAAQALRTEVTTGPALRPIDGAPAAVGSAFLRALWIARPDLRRGILAAAEDGPCPNEGVAGLEAMLLGGNFAFVKSTEDFAAWRCDVENTKSWIWLTSDLTLGNTVTHQLVPDIAEDVFLHITVAAIEDVAVPAGTYANCLRVDYRIDYGEGICTDPETGNPVGLYRSETAGYVHFAPGVGPVQSFEELTAYTEASGGCGIDPALIGAPTSRTTLKLRTESTVPARLSTWGRIKAAYGDQAPGGGSDRHRDSGRGIPSPVHMRNTGRAPNGPGGRP